MKTTQSSSFKKSLIGTLVVAMLASLGMPSRSWAMLVPTEARDNVASGDRAEDLKTIQAALESKIVRQRLAELKMNPAEINGRLSQLSDSQVHQAALQIRAMSPGGDVGGILILVLLVLLIIYLVRRI